ncbi:MAG: tRNA 2-thiouridine(34) synthase MnmA [Desulfobacterales bacterium]|nr:tRNA 2-thiouridine(34) synthase MnmA [Desulfobacterales bacterium]
MKPLIAIAISGGIDSLVAAYLLKKQRYDVIGIHFISGYEKKQKISQIADQLDIHIEIIDCRAAFKSKIVDYFTRTYQAGKTPNPCLICNPTIKFGIVLDHALKMEASYLATGHYARIKKSGKDRYQLLKGVDRTKDQSYFLAFLSQNQLSTACFPLGGITKSKVLQLAGEKGLTPIRKKESQDICFIKGQTYGEFLIRQETFRAQPGLIENVNGKVIGEHQGLHLFTVGQRRGINCPASEPYYVVRMDQKTNRLIVGFKEDLLSWKCRITNLHWIYRPTTSPIKVHTRLRYRHEAVASMLFPINVNTAMIKFKTPQMAITPGQGAVFYKEDEVLGGGWIDIAEND